MIIDHHPHTSTIEIDNVDPKVLLFRRSVIPRGDLQKHHHVIQSNNQLINQLSISINQSLA